MLRKTDLFHLLLMLNINNHNVTDKSIKSYEHVLALRIFI